MLASTRFKPYAPETSVLWYEQALEALVRWQDITVLEPVEKFATPEGPGNAFQLISEP